VVVAKSSIFLGGINFLVLSTVANNDDDEGVLASVDRGTKACVDPTAAARAIKEHEIFILVM
jgi:hypothetical protein